MLLVILVLVQVIQKMWEYGDYLGNLAVADQVSYVNFARTWKYALLFLT
jgi:hypothetical protein